MLLAVEQPAVDEIAGIGVPRQVLGVQQD